MTTLHRICQGLCVALAITLVLVAENKRVSPLGCIALAAGMVATFAVAVVLSERKRT